VFLLTVLFALISISRFLSNWSESETVAPPQKTKTV
jgi:hypothetical protein